MQQCHSHQIKIEYQRIFDFIDNGIFEKISSEIENIYQEYIFYIQDYKIKGGTLGRGNLKWGRNIIWSWFIEKIFLHILQQNSYFKSVSLYHFNLTYIVRLINFKLKWYYMAEILLICFYTIKSIK